MFRPQIQKTRILSIMAIISICLVILVAKSSTFNEFENVNSRYEAVDLMSNCINSIKTINNLDIHSQDYYKTGLIGLKKTKITTVLDNENLDNILNAKIITTHPNFAAFVVLLFEELGLEYGDSIAVSMPGSFPGANIAILSACKTLEVTPVIISSLGSSSWGANKESLTWIDIEDHLYSKGLIDFRSIAVSIGGKNDLGENISDEGIEILEEIIQRSDVLLINELNLNKSIKKKINLFGNMNDYDAFINIGGGASSLGKGLGKMYLKGGIISPLSKDDIQEIYYDSDNGDKYHEDFKESIAYKFLNDDISVINIKNINSLISEYGMSYLSDRKLNKLKQGSLFYEVEKFNIKTIWFALIITVFISLVVGLYSHIQIKERMKEDEIDSIL